MTAFDCVHRGVVNVRANWELLLMHVLQGVLCLVVGVVGFLPILAAIGWANPDLFDLLENPEMAFGVLQGLIERSQQGWVLLLAALVIASVIWLISMLVYSYFKGGILAVLMAGDRQAPAGSATQWAWFRTFSVHDFRGWAGRYLWRYFWLYQIFFVVVTVWLVLAGLVVALAGWGAQRWGTSAALGIGCGGIVPLSFGLFVLVFWLGVAQADLALEDSNVGLASKRSLALVGRRFLALVFIALVALVLQVLVGLGSWTASVFFTALLSRWLLVGLGAQFTLTIAQWVLSAAVSLSVSAALISLVRTELLREAAS